MSRKSASTIVTTDTRPDPDEARPHGGRHAVVTGGGRGIGAAVAEALARLGASVTLIGRDRAALDDEVFRIEESFGVTAFAAPADVTDSRSVDIAFADSFEALGPATILVNNAGAVESAKFECTDLALWQAMIAVNATSAYLCTQAALPAMRAAAWGRVVNIASTAGLKGYRTVSAYCAAKHALIGLTRGLASELAKTGITVNAVCPGFTGTEPASANPQGRLIDAAEVANAVAWLCAPETRAITGQAIVVAGGEVM
jgi:NAD(P)-dependent dehydrogenase (short-subunit alcohol dehydrogenase family)